MKNLEKAKACLIKQSLKDFVKEFWPIVEPGTPYVHGWHIDAICEHLEACYRREIRNIIINMPPRCMKSLLISVFYPVWVWIQNPAERFIFSSYAQSLSVRDSIKCRRLIESPLFQLLFGDLFKLSGDQNTKLRFDNDKTGYRLATSIDGATTGEGGDQIIVDDAQSASEAGSEAVVLSTTEYFDGTLSTRGNNPKTVVFIVVMQRLAENDLTGHLLEKGGFEHLVLPMEFDPEKRCRTSIGWQDPRTIEGELLWPERFDEAYLTTMRQKLGSYHYSGQMNQAPSPKGGGMFKREWFEIVKAVPAIGKRVRYWDRAGTVKKKGNSPDWTVGLKMCKDRDGVHYIEHVSRFQESSLKVQTSIENFAKQDGYPCKIYLEQEPGASGKAEVETIIRKLGGFAAYADPKQVDKITRASPLSAQAEAGNVKLLEGDWNQDFLDELSKFPLGKHDDQVDAASGAYYALNSPGVDYEALVQNFRRIS